VTRRFAASRFVLTVLLLAGPVIEGFAQQYPFIQLGGPDAPKGCLFPFEDSQGGIWLAGCETGNEGFFYFDGARFFSPLKGAMPRGVVRGMAEDNEGGIWIASSAGVYRYYRGDLQKVADGAAWAGITMVAPDVFLVTLDTPAVGPEATTHLVRIARIRNAWKAEVIVSPISQVQFRVDSSGHILYGCEGGYCEATTADVARWQSGSTLAVTHHAVETRTGYAGGSSVVLRDRQRCIWMRSGNDASYQCPGDRHTTVLPASLASQGFPLILELQDGSIAIPSYSKLAMGRPGKFRVVDTANGYPNTGGALATGDGNILLNNANGLFLFLPSWRMEFWSAGQGLNGNTWSILRSAGRTFAVAGDSIRELETGRDHWRLFASLNRASSLLAGPGRSILAASHTDGVVQISQQGGMLRHSEPVDISKLERTPDGQYWAGGDGLFRVHFDGPRLILEPVSAAGPQASVLDMQVDGRGGLWTCVGAGLAHKDESEWRMVSIGNHDECRSFAMDSEGAIWYSDGVDSVFLIRHPEGPAPQFQSAGGLDTTHSNFLAVDRRGLLWNGTPSGIHIADRAEARRGQWLNLDRTDGLPAIDANQKSFFEDSDGSIWFGADDSVIHLFPPADLVHPTTAPSVFVSGFSWNGGAPQMADLMGAIKSGSNITAYIGSLQFDRRNNLRLRYRLLPGQHSWHETANLDLALGKPGRGSHTLEVQARLFTGPWSQTVSRSFTVLPPVGLTWPFLLAYVALGISLPFAWYLLRRRRQAEEAVLLPDLAAWRMGALLPEVHELTGSVLDSRFEVGDLLARGGFANVMSGFDRVQQQRCAIKVFRNEVNDKGWAQRRFDQEVIALQQVRHPNVVSIYAHGVSPAGAPYLVMEFVDGKCLREVLERGALPAERLARLLQQLAAALGAIHGQNIWHRDVKPENVMLRYEGTPEEEPVLIDFSIAIVKDADATLHGLSRAAGTFDYMAPEQAIGYAQPSSDIYSLAKLTIEMLTGRRVSQLLPDAALDLPDRVRELARNLGAGLSEDSVAVLGAALEFDPAKRPQDVGSFADPIVKDLASGVHARQR
jgi:tRNA A-37 threonylcarbamoyl transferase component Bud32